MLRNYAFSLSVACVSALLSFSATAITVNKLNGGMTVAVVDFSIPGPVVPVELIRSYNSISGVTEVNGYNGSFGWGWTTLSDTSLRVTPERQVIVRDGSTGNNVFFKSEKEDPKVREAFFESLKKAYFERKNAKKYPPSELAKLTLPDKMLMRLKSDPDFRVEMAVKFNVSASIPRDELLISSEYGYQTIYFKNNQWIRERDGITQFFDKEGRLIRQKDRNGFFLDFKYSPAHKSQVVEINSQDRATTLKFVWRGDRIVEVIDNRGRRSRYTYDAQGNMVDATDSSNQVYQYKYENKKFPHLLTKVEYVSENTAEGKVFREIKYDENGLVVYHRDKDATEYQYTYGKKPQDPENNFWTKTVKRSKGATEELYDEYFIRQRSDGSKYLFKQETKLGGVLTTTLFTPCCGKPTQIIKNGEVTNFKYYDNGLLAERVSPTEDVRFEYDPRWKKVTKVNQSGVISEYQYDDAGNLTKASNSKKQSLTLKYDKMGRVTEITEGTGRNLAFKYGDQGKPTVISEKGLGTLKIDYDSDGRIVRTQSVVPKEKGRKPSEMRSQEVVQTVMKSFQSALDIIRPAGSITNSN